MRSQTAGLRIAERPSAGREVRGIWRSGLLVVQLATRKVLTMISKAHEQREQHQRIRHASPAAASRKHERTDIFCAPSGLQRPLILEGRAPARLLWPLSKAQRRRSGALQRALSNLQPHPQNQKGAAQSPIPRPSRLALGRSAVRKPAVFERTASPQPRATQFPANG